ncbi:MAG: molybdopterin-dependent oxidoreductase [Gaiellaceae bacterium MAG52_C11]|nr:molybdopterin-dependent oxidoreductase [Candidatus Gaiellasilicea maunaloa]
MKLRAIATGAVAGVLAMLVFAVAALLLRSLGVPLPLELVSDRVLPFLPVETFLKLVSAMGGFVAGKKIGFFAFFLSLIAIGAAIGAAYGFAATRVRPARLLLGLVAGAVVTWLLMLALLYPALDSNYRGLPPGRATLATAVGLLVLLTLVAGSLAFFHRIATQPRASEPGTDDGPLLRRGPVVLGLAGGALALASGGLVTRLYRRSAIPYDGFETRAAKLDPITPNERWYVVTKNFVDPRVDRSLWRLEVRGMVENESSMSFEELEAMPSVEQVTTLECISNGIGAGLISNAVWRGVPLASLLERAGVEGGATHLFARGSDGYGHGLTLEKGMEETTLIVYRMNGEPLPDRHGFPARLIVPGGYGEMSVKWLDRVEVLDEPEQGLYESQGWRAERVHTMSRIDRPLGRRKLRVGRPVAVNGVAFAGDRGIERVELSTDGGRSWREVDLDYRASKLTWALWSGEWTPERAGMHELVVRATDGEGTPQESKKQPINPDGASGYHKIKVEVGEA